MRITCPACAARYDVPAAAVPPAGRRVRCKACGEQWTAMPEPLALGEEAPEPAPAPARASAPRRRGRRWLWLVALLALAAGLAAGWVLATRAGIAPAVSLPTLSATPAAPTRLTLTANAVNRPVAGGGNVWEVSGVITNPTGAPLRVPPVEVTLLADGGREFYRWQVPAPAATLEPGGKVTFETATVNTPADAAKVRVRLRD